MVYCDGGGSLPFHSNARSRSLKFTAVDTVDMSMDKRLNQIANRIEKIPERIVIY